jgi:GLPGLI family protein
MKKQILFGLLTLVVSIGLFSFNQAKLTEGVVEYDISFVDLSPEMKEMEAMLPKNLTMYFKGQSIRGEMPSGMGNTVTIANEKTKEFYVLMDMMGQKTAIKQTEADLKEQQKKQDVKDVKVTLSPETKTIAGYACKKAVITFTMKGSKETLNCFYSPDLPSIGNKRGGPGFDQINGMMMEYQMNLDGIKMHIAAKKVRAEKVDDNKFIIPEGYTIKTAEELKKGLGE